MNTTELEKIASLPAIQDAIRAQAEATEAESLSLRLGELAGYHHTLDEIDELKDQAAKLDAMQDELDRQSDELTRQRAAHAIELQRVNSRHRASIRELRNTHGSGLALAIGRTLANQADALRREADYQRIVRDKKEHWTGVVAEVPSPEAMRRADELERRAIQIEHERDAIMALEFARLSPQAIQRDILARVKGLGFNVNTTAEPAGWRVEGWDTPKTKAVPGHHVPREEQQDL